MTMKIGKDRFYHKFISLITIAKNKDYYKKYKWNVDSTAGYVWLDENGNWYEQKVMTGEKYILY